MLIDLCKQRGKELGAEEGHGSSPAQQKNICLRPRTPTSTGSFIHDTGTMFDGSQSTAQEHRIFQFPVVPLTGRMA